MGEGRWVGEVGEAAHGELGGQGDEVRSQCGVSVGRLPALVCALDLCSQCSQTLWILFQPVLFVALSSPLLSGGSPSPLLSLAAHFSLVFQPQFLLEDSHARALLLTSAPATSSVSSWPVGSFHSIFQPWLQIQTVIVLKTFSSFQTDPLYNLLICVTLPPFSQASWL